MSVEILAQNDGEGNGRGGSVSDSDRISCKNWDAATGPLDGKWSDGNWLFPHGSRCPLHGGELELFFEGAESFVAYRCRHPECRPAALASALGHYHLAHILERLKNVRWPWDPAFLGSVLAPDGVFLGGDVEPLPPAEYGAFRAECPLCGQDLVLGLLSECEGHRVFIGCVGGCRQAEVLRAVGLDFDAVLFDAWDEFWPGEDDDYWAADDGEGAVGGESRPVCPAANPQKAEPLCVSYRDDKNKLCVTPALCPPVSALALMSRHYRDVRFAVDGLVTPGLNVLAGKPKLGKSWLALDLCVAVASGRPVFDQHAVTRAGALYLALEDTERRLQRRLRKLLGDDEDVPRMLYFHCDWPRMGRGGDDLLRHWLGQNPSVRLVAVDTWAKVRPSRKNRADVYAEDYEHAARLKKLADDFGVAVLAVHHCRKGDGDDWLDEVSGSNGLTGAADTILVLSRKRGQSDATLKVTGRDIEEEKSLRLAWDAELARWTLAGMDAVAAMSEGRTVVLDLVQKAGRPVTLAELQGSADLNKGTLKSLLSRMRKDGQLAGDGQGSYWVPGKGAEVNATPQPLQPATGGLTSGVESSE